MEGQRFVHTKMKMSCLFCVTFVLCTACSMLTVDRTRRAVHTTKTLLLSVSLSYLISICGARVKVTHLCFSAAPAKMRCTLMIDSSLPPRRNTYMRPENMEIGSRVNMYLGHEYTIYIYDAGFSLQEAGSVTVHIHVLYSIMKPSVLQRINICAVLKDCIIINMTSNKEVTWNY